MSKYTVSIEPNNQKITLLPNQTILDGSLRQGAWIPNSCNQGTCGTCVVRVKKGEVDHVDSPFTTLPISDRKQNLALACQAVACSDITIEPEITTLDAGPIHPLRNIYGTVVSLEDVARDTRRVRIRLDEPLGFNPGQHVELKVPSSGESRHYSVANIPEECGTTEVIELHVRREAGGMCSDRWIFSRLQLGERVDLTGPLGDFWLRDQETEGGIIMVAGGTGLAPITSILQSLLRLQPDREIHLYFSVRQQQDLYDTDKLRRLALLHPNFHFVQCLTREDWTDGRTGYATDFIPDDFSTLRGWSGYICGPPVMVDACRKAFKRRRMSPRRIHWEKYLPAHAEGSAHINV